MVIFVGNGLTYVSLNVSLGLEKTVGGKYGRSKEAVPVFFVQLRSEYFPIVNMYTCIVKFMLAFVGNSLTEFSQCQPWP